MEASHGFSLWVVVPQVNDWLGLGKNGIPFLCFEMSLDSLAEEREIKRAGTCMKNTRTKPKGVGSRVGSGDGWGGGSDGRKMETTILEQQ